MLWMKLEKNSEKLLKAFKNNKNNKKKIALCFRYAQTLLNLAFARFFGAIFSK
jgi:hypothetical protein